MDEQRRKLMTFALASGSFAIIVVGLAVALAGQWFGWLIAAFGALDAASIPFVLRAIGSRRSRASGDLTGEATASVEERPDPDSTAADPTTSSSYNPYARED